MKEIGERKCQVCPNGTATNDISPRHYEDESTVCLTLTQILVIAFLHNFSNTNASWTQCDDRWTDIWLYENGNYVGKTFRDEDDVKENVGWRRTKIKWK